MMTSANKGTKSMNAADLEWLLNMEKTEVLEKTLIAGDLDDATKAKIQAEINARGDATPASILKSWTK